MASIAILLWVHLDFTRVEWTNWSITMAFFVCALTALLSFLANISTFLEHAFGPSLGLERAMRRLKRRGHSSGRATCKRWPWRRPRKADMARFVAIDVETANTKRASICQIGLVVYDNRKVVDEWSTLHDGHSPRCFDVFIPWTPSYWLPLRTTPISRLP